MPALEGWNVLDRPVALVTGASRGIGAAIARELSRRGYALALAARSEEPLAVLSDELRQSGVPALAIPTDLRDLDQVRDLARIALAHYGRVDALVNNAGVGGMGRMVVELDEARIAELLTVNLYAPIALTRALLPQMLNRRAGAVILIGSVAGRIGLPGSALYAASKFGLRGFALALRREVAHRGIGVTLIAPGFIETAMTARLRGFPKDSPDLVARVVADALRRPRREITVPGIYRAIIAIEHMLPGLADVILMRARQPRDPD